MPAIWYPITYYTYNLPQYYACVVALILFLAFFICTFRIFIYEVLNARNICEPTYYYGQACNNLISDTVQSDKSFSQAKQAFYTQADLYAAANTTGSGQVSSADIDITENIEDNNSFTQETIKQITDITNLIKGLTQKYLGNMKKMVDTSSGALQEIPRYLTELQNAIQTTTSNSMLSKYTAPLEKLYQSLSDMNDDTGNSGN